MAELAQLVHGLRLAALQVADEAPAKAVAPAGVLVREILRAVLADDLDAGVGEQSELVDRHVLRRDDDRDGVARRRAGARPRAGGRSRARGRSACSRP